MSPRLPSFLIKPVPKQENIRRVRALLGDNSLHTVCEEAKCPNIGECFARQTCTFLILGGTCTRNCAFCGVDHGRPAPVDPTEPERLAAAVKKLGLKYVVITSVTRDDLPDGGASHFAAVLFSLRVTRYPLLTEVLIPDFNGDEKALRTVLDAQPSVLNHNVETVPRLYPEIRPQATYQRSLALLTAAKRHSPSIYTKSGFMVGLGETKEEVAAVLSDLKRTNCDIVTIGQYLPPSRAHRPPDRYVTPEEFAGYQTIGRQLGLSEVVAGPFVRSSYHAEATINHVKSPGSGPIT
ncbi:MAG: lipoyl synthase [Candidatus Margulisbacteria bacterium]|jgi:lipoic acid synthetase|nr:lipoyl synthase [Candidatus Margulisiibacteriota bacterium]